MNGEHPSKEKLQRHYDGDLNEQEAAELRLHLRTCAPCKAELDGLERLSDMLRWSTDDAAAASDADFTSMFAEIERRISQPGEASQPTNVISIEQRRSGASRLNRAMPVLGALALAAAALLMLTRKEAVPNQAASEQYALLDTAQHSEVVAVKFGRNAGQVFGIPLADGESVPVVWIDDVDEYEEE